LLRIGVLISGGGTNLQALIDAVEDKTLNAEISVVIADRPAGGLKRAAAAGIPAVLIDRKLYGKELSGRIKKELEEEVDLVVLAGFLSILDSSFVKSFNGRIINIHPALLPAYGGKGMHGINVHRAVIAAGEKRSGCTVHFVEEGIDTGRIIAQREVPVKPYDTPHTLARRILKEEHKLLVSAVRKISRDMEMQR
jgi:phosphoribosylglycinamide formyltransferase-1